MFKPLKLFKMLKKIIVILTFNFTLNLGYSQATQEYLVPAKVENGDTIPYVELDEVYISKTEISPIVNLNKAKYSKLIRDVKKAYPYAVVAGIKLKEYNELISKATNESEKKKMMKQAEDDIKKQFSADIENMTLTQGKILLKLIYRQTGVTSYEIVKELRGSLRAVFYQALARLFGANLKMEYDPIGDDKAIEEIVTQIENGTI